MTEYLLQRAPVRSTRKLGAGTEAQKKALGLIPVSEDARRAALGLPPATGPVLPPPKPSHARSRR